MRASRADLLDAFAGELCVRHPHPLFLRRLTPAGHQIIAVAAGLRATTTLVGLVQIIRAIISRIIGGDSAPVAPDV